MKTIYLTVKKIDGKVQHLNDIYPVIETNTILNKTITGIGATYSEIKAPRNSIIIEPTKPVIYCKCNDPKHANDNLLGVHDRVYQDKIISYIEKSIKEGKYIKILTTPESFPKVQDAFEELDLDIRFDGYFLLFDEVQKTVKDCDYRQDITLPMDLFFECRDKAIVSATPPRKFRDPRFDAFSTLKIVPDFDFRKEIKLCVTNNVLQYTKELLKSLEGNECPIFLFVNSTEMIHSLMYQLKKTEQSAVFCSEKSVDKLNRLDFNRAFENWDQSKMARYNWMTSRFYSALDIELLERPDIIMLTDCYIADYTMIDPYMDAVQIVGRFRNGVNDIYHISNTNSNIPETTEEELIVSLKCAASVYEHLGTLAESASTEEQRKQFLYAQSSFHYTKFLDENGKLKYFVVDNHIDEELTKSCYHDYVALRKGYDASEYFHITYTSQYYKVSDYDRLKIENKNATVKEKRMEIVRQLEQLGECETEMEQQYKRDLAFANPIIVEAYDVIGKDAIESLKYRAKAIREAIIVKRHQENACSTDAIRLIYTIFDTQKWYSSNYIKRRLKEVFVVLKIPHPKAITSHTILQYFEATYRHRKDKKTNKDKRGYYLISQRFA